MRVSRTRFSKRRIKRKTEFPIVAVVQKKRKVESVGTFGAIQSLSFGILNNQTGGTKQQKKSWPSSPDEQKLDSTLNEGKALDIQSTEVPDFSAKANQSSTQSLKDSKAKQKKSALKPQKKSRATIDYKNVILLRNLITAEGKILPRRINKLTAKQQRYVQKAIKSARIMGLIPFINKSRPF